MIPHLHVQVEDLIAEGNIVARLTIGGTQRGTFQEFPATGREVSWTGMDFIRFRDGRMVERWSEREFLGMLRKLGHLPAAD